MTMCKFNACFTDYTVLLPCQIMWRVLNFLAGHDTTRFTQNKNTHLTFHTKSSLYWFQFTILIYPVVGKQEAEWGMFGDNKWKIKR